jgi:hypothetical protein
MSSRLTKADSLFFLLPPVRFFLTLSTSNFAFTMIGSRFLAEVTVAGLPTLFPGRLSFIGLSYKRRINNYVFTSKGMYACLNI